MRYYVIVLSLLLCLTIPLHAQDNPTPYDVALQRIQEAASTGATELDLSFSWNLTELPPEIGHLANLEVLNLDYSGLSTLPPEIGQLTNLRELRLGMGIRFSSLPPEIGQLTNLQLLYLASSQLMSLPPEIGQLTNLQWLDLSSNELTILPPEIGQLTNLQLLFLCNNHLMSVPSEIGQLINLQWLYLDNNQLRHLPNEMSNLTNLTCADCSLGLEGNPLISPPPEVVQQGTAAILAYLRNEAWYHVQRLIIAGASGVGLLTMLLLGIRFRQSRRKVKVKRG